MKWFRILAIIVSVGVMLLSHATLASGSPLVGVWEGSINVSGQELIVVFRFAEHQGSLTGTGDIPAQNAFNLKTKDLAVEGNQVNFAYVDVPAAYAGELSSDGNSIAGMFIQGPAQFPFIITRRPAQVIEPGQLDALRSVIQATLEQWNVPGAAVSIVKDGQVVLADGFGLRDVEANLPVTAETLFGIGSSTKAFTATTFQALVEAGKLTWDAPVQATLSHLKLHDRWVAEQITARDFALHRSGLPRHDIPWMFNLDLDLDAFLAAGDTLQPSAGFRTTWQYNNLGYAILGRMIEQATGATWDDVVATRLLQPLGMNATNFTVEAMEATANYAKTYGYNGSEHFSIALEDIGAAQAAGAINSTANDIAQWLLFNTGLGRVGETELMTAAGVRELHTGQISAPSLMPGPEIRYTGYGLGWFTHDYRGHHRAEHGGNTMGFSANVAVLPETGIGVAVLTNAAGSPAASIIVNQVLDTLLGLEPIDWNGRMKMQAEAQAAAMAGAQGGSSRQTGTAPSHALDDYVGVYTHPAYGDVAIVRSGESLLATYYSTTIPLEHWHYDQFRGPLNELVPLPIPFSFVTNAQGEVGEVAIGFEPTVSPIRFTRKTDARMTDPTFLASLAGEYDFAGMPANISVRGTTLVLSVAGQVITLEPVTGTRFEMTNTPVVTLELVLDAATGTVAKAILVQPTGTVEMLPKR